MLRVTNPSQILRVADVCRRYFRRGFTVSEGLDVASDAAISFAC